MRGPAPTNLALVVSLCAAFGAAPSGAQEYILWEAEDPAETDIRQRGSWLQTSLNAEAPAKLSGGKWISYYAKRGGAGRFLRYRVHVPRDGAYVLWVRKFHSHGPFSWRFDQAQWANCGRDVKLWGKAAKLGPHLSASWVRLGDVDLDKGTRELRVRVISTTDRDINFAMDCFLLTPSAEYVPEGKVPPSVVGPTASRADPGRGAGTFFLRRGDGVLFLGDAVTVDGGYMELARARIAGEYPALAPVGGDGLEFVNGGLAGATARDSVRRLADLSAERRPDVVVVCFGSNDFFMGRDRYAASLRSIVKTLKARMVAVTLMTPLALDARGRPELETYIALVDGMAGDVRSIAATENVILADCHARSRTHVEGGAPDLSWGDGIHPGEIGRRMMAEALLAAWGLGKPLFDADD